MFKENYDLNIKFYGLIISISFLFFFSYLFITAYKRKMPFLFKLMVGILCISPFLFLGARIWTFFWDDFLKKFNEQKNISEKLIFFFGFKDGILGLSIHGSLVFGFIYIFFLFVWYSKKTKISKLYLFDWFTPAVLIMQIIGRIGNFLNQENFGKNGEYLFLYEMIGNFIILLIILFLLPNLYKFFSHDLWQKQKKWNDNLNNLKNKINKNTSIFKKIILYIKFLKQKNTYLNNALKFNYFNEKKEIEIKLFGTNKSYYKEINILYNSKKNINWLLRRIKLFFLRDSSKLINFYNFYNFTLIRVGTTFTFYIIFSFLLRFFLQFLRKETEKMNITFYFLIISIIFSIFFFIFFQFFFPKKFRSKEWFYENRY